MSLIPTYDDIVLVYLYFKVWSIDGPAIARLTSLFGLEQLHVHGQRKTGRSCGLRVIREFEHKWI